MCAKRKMENRKESKNVRTSNDILACLLDMTAVVVDVEIQDTITRVVLVRYMVVDRIFLNRHQILTQGTVVYLVLSYAMLLRLLSPILHQRLKSKICIKKKLWKQYRFLYKYRNKMIKKGILKFIDDIFSSRVYIK